MSELLSHLTTRRSELLRAIRELEMDIAALDRLIESERSIAERSLERHKPVQRRGLKPGALPSQIIEVMSRTPGQEWTSGQIREAVMAKTRAPGDYQLPEEDLKSRNAVSAAVGEMRRDGHIVQVRPSQGPHPAIYRLKEEVS